MWEINKKHGKIKRDYVTGDIIGKLEFIKILPIVDKKPRKLLFKCRCEKEFECSFYEAKNEKTVSCGCAKRTRIVEYSTTHGHASRRNRKHTTVIFRNTLFHNTFNLHTDFHLYDMLRVDYKKQN